MTPPTERLIAALTGAAPDGPPPVEQVADALDRTTEQVQTLRLALDWRRAGVVTTTLALRRTLRRPERRDEVVALVAAPPAYPGVGGWEQEMGGGG